MKKIETMSVKNKKFWALPKAEKRVAIAKDIIKSLAAKKIKANTGDYFDIGVRPSKDGQLDKVLNQGTCTVCALGACFYSLVNMGDNITVSKVVKEDTDEFDDYISDIKFRPYLRKIFTPRQLTLIECAFEKSLIMYDDNDNNRKNDFPINYAQSFGRDYDNDEERLVGIMENIVKNKGTFKP